MFLGHRKVDTTTLYIQLERALFNVGSDEFHSATARTIEEATNVTEAGFEYIATTTA